MHAPVWWANGDDVLSKKATADIQRELDGGQIVVSAITAREIAMLFTTFQPNDSLPAQAAREEEVYLRFRRAMYANDIAAAVADSQNSDAITAEQIEAMVQAGPGRYPPNNEGIWTVLTAFRCA
ncbi:hypothetical protein [Paraburkholderia aromaticivorans]|uniref:hypothetical protein n=1 Tax=Paraburkholderia aromaticivorans TaxID=2026199 RepID=UPI0019807946|nr:hypothetical protein [Paraburkholderia aromaticivorans]